MIDKRWIAAIVAIAVIAIGYAVTHRYSFIRMDEETLVRIDHWTGKSATCSLQWPCPWDDATVALRPIVDNPNINLEDLAAPAANNAVPVAR